MYAIFDSLAVFSQWEAQVNTLLGFPNNFGTKNYTNPIGKIAEVRVIALVTDEIDTSGLVTISAEQATADGWLPNMEMTNKPIYYSWDEDALAWVAI